MDGDNRAALFAHCAAGTVNALSPSYDRRPRALAHADRLATLTGLDLAEHWTPTVDTYLGRVTKAQILEAVREAKGATSAQLIEPLKKGDMAREAERLLAGTGWLPQVLRTPGLTAPALPLAGPRAGTGEGGSEAPLRCSRPFWSRVTPTRPRLSRRISRRPSSPARKSPDRQAPSRRRELACLLGRAFSHGQTRRPAACAARPRRTRLP